MHAGRSTSFKAADLIELSPLVELIMTVNALFIGATEVESEALSIEYYSRTSVAGKAWNGTGRRIVVAVVGSITTIVPAVSTLLSLNLRLLLLVLTKAKVIAAVTLTCLLTWEASAEAAIKNIERVSYSPANLQELRLGRSLKILGEVKVFVFIFGGYMSVESKSNSSSFRGTCRGIENRTYVGV